MRLDLIEPDALDAVIADLLSHAMRPVFVLDTALEGAFFTARFKTQQWSRLTWPARAEISAASSILYYDIGDREAFLSGDRWATDVLVGGPTTSSLVGWSDYRAPLERVVLATPQDTRLFRSVLETMYRDTLGRAPAPAVDSELTSRWLRRYVRHRLHGCSHDVAQDKVLLQISRGQVPSLCARPETVVFPPSNETLEFRRALDRELAATPRVATAVDPEGEAVWLQRYLELRAQGCQHASATAAVLAQVAGRAGPCD